MRRSRPMQAAVWCALSLSPCAGADVIYVKQAACGANTGESWGDAFLDLHDALAVAQAGDEIWVAAGRYTPDRGTGDRAISFVLVPGVSFYGGFGGWETHRDQRDWVANRTILSGDLNDDDHPHACEQLSSCCAEHDGVGCDDPSCEAIVCSRAPDCCRPPDPKNPDEPLYWWNWSCGWIARRECCFLSDQNQCENSIILVMAEDVGSSTVVDGFTISAAYATEAERIWLTASAGISVTGSAPTLRNCTVRDNARGVETRGDFIGWNCAFVANLAEGVWLGGHDTHAEADECLFADNRGGLVGGGDIRVSNSRFERNRHALGAGDLLLAVGCEFVDNFYATGGAFYGALFMECGFYDNFVGAAVSGVGANRFHDCVFYRNLSNSIVASSPYLEVLNTLFVGNGPINSMETAYLANCTFTENPGNAYLDGAFYVNAYSATTVESGIFWNNGTVGSPDVHVGYQATLTVLNSIVDGVNGTWGGSGNRVIDPLFADPVGADNIPVSGDEDYRLSVGSPAINAGAITSLTPDTDLDGHSRVLCDAIDLGPYEFGIGDYDCDRTLTPADFPAWTWCMQGPLDSLSLAKGEGGVRVGSEMTSP